MFDAEATERFFLTGAWKSLTYRGVPIYKTPNDLMVYHELIWRERPQLIVELGTAIGGSAAWFADQQRVAGILGAQVVTIDVERHWQHQEDAVHYVVGDSLAPDTFEYVADIATNFNSTMLVHDSNHTYGHVLLELTRWAPLISIGEVVVVEDTFLAYMESDEASEPFSDGNDPLAALRDFHEIFEPIPECDKYEISFNPGGWLRRVR